jgi:hypothetical protein
MVLVLSELQAANHLDRISFCGIQEIGIEHLPRPQDLHVDQIEIRPFILVGDGGIDGTEDGIFAGAHDCDGFGGIMISSSELEEVGECDFEVSWRENKYKGESRLESRDVNSEGPLMAGNLPIPGDTLSVID